MTDDEKRIKALGAKVKLLADLKLRAERRLEAAETELRKLRRERADADYRVEQMKRDMDRIIGLTANAQREAGLKPIVPSYWQDYRRLEQAIKAHRDATLKRTPPELHKKPGRWTMWSLDEVRKCEHGHATSTDYVLWGAIDPPGKEN